MQDLAHSVPRLGLRRLQQSAPSLGDLFDTRANNFDFVRLFLAVTVIFSHSYPLGSGTDISEPFLRATHRQADGGAIAVNLFFVLSGFLITNSFLQSQSIWSYLKKRIFRIYPAFVTAAVVCALIVAPLASAASPYAGIGRRLADFLLRTASLREFSYINAFNGNPYPGSINGSAWTIPMEFECYIGLAILGITGILKNRALVLSLFAVLVAASVVFVVVASPGYDPATRSGRHLMFFLVWSRLISMYLAGVVFYLFRNVIPHKMLWAIVAGLMLLVSAFLPFTWSACFPVAGSYLAFWFGFHPRVPLHNFGQSGDFSYGTYLYAFPIQQLIVFFAGQPLNPGVMFGIACPLALLAGAVSWYAVERRFLVSVRHSPAVYAASSAS